MIARAETSRADDAAPFDLAGGPDAALLLHGFSGSPFEVRLVAERLARDGVRCVGPVLPGHDGPAERLIGVRWKDWVEAGREALHRLDGSRRILVLGCSMGALVALALAHSEPARVSALALLAPALRLRALSRVASFLAHETPLPRWIPIIPKFGGTDIHDREMRARNPCQDAISLAGLSELVDFQRAVDRMLPGIAAPALCVAGGQDHTVALSGVRRLARRIGSGPARVLVLPDSYHLVGLDVERGRCANEVAAFFANVR